MVTLDYSGRKGVKNEEVNECKVIRKSEEWRGIMKREMVINIT